MTAMNMAPGDLGVRARLRDLVEGPGFQRAIIALIIVNAAILGLETAPGIMATWGPTLLALDAAILWIFVAEIALRLWAHGPRFFRNGWNLFDLAVVAIALAPESGPLAVLRALRVLRVMRLISVVPSMRHVAEALLRSVPGLGAIIALLAVLFYVFAVMATKLFGATNPELFGTIGASLYALLQVMTLEGWSGDIVNPVLEHHRYALVFFIPFMLLSTFTVLNLFIALIVDSMQKLAREEDEKPAPSDTDARLAEMTAELAALRRAVERLSTR
jgi:voltage-gated sodium channel